MKRAMQQILGTGAMSGVEVFEALKAKGWLPNSKDPLKYVRYLLSSERGHFKRDPVKGRGFYRVVVRKETSKPSAPLTVTSPPAPPAVAKPPVLPLKSHAPKAVKPVKPKAVIKKTPPAAKSNPLKKVLNAIPKAPKARITTRIRQLVKLSLPATKAALFELEKRGKVKKVKTGFHLRWSRTA